MGFNSRFSQQIQQDFYDDELIFDGFSREDFFLILFYFSFYFVEPQHTNHVPKITSMCDVLRQIKIEK